MKASLKLATCLTLALTGGEGSATAKPEPLNNDIKQAQTLARGLIASCKEDVVIADPTGFPKVQRTRFVELKPDEISSDRWYVALVRRSDFQMEQCLCELKDRILTCSFLEEGKETRIKVSDGGVAVIRREKGWPNLEVKLSPTGNFGQWIKRQLEAIHALARVKIEAQKEAMRAEREKWNRDCKFVPKSPFHLSQQAPPVVQNNFSE